MNNDEDLGENVENLEFAAEFLRDATVAFLMKNLQNKTTPANWPDLKKVKLSSQEELKKYLSRSKLNAEKNVPVVAIAESEKSFVGQQVSLKLLSFQKIKSFFNSFSILSVTLRCSFFL